MPTAYLRPGEFVEILSYDMFITGLGLSIAAGIVRISPGTSATWVGLLVSSGILASLGVFLWRLSASIEKRVANMISELKQ